MVIAATHVGIILHPKMVHWQYDPVNREGDAVLNQFERRLGIAVCPQLDDIAARIAQGHFRLLILLCDMRNGGRQFKLDVFLCQLLRKYFPLLPGQHGTEMPDALVFPGNDLSRLLMEGDLAAEHVNVAPLLALPADRRTENLLVKIPGGIKFVDRKRQMEHWKMHNNTYGQLRP